MKINRDSPFFRIPNNICAQQAIFFDGIRHATEIANLAYSRLRETLTEIAFTGAEDVRHEYTSALCDAWTVVDALDRYRTLWKSLPGSVQLPPTEEFPPIEDQFSNIRSIRNVGDHIAQRVPYIVAHNGTALGILKWVTLIKEDPIEFHSFVLVPGTAKTITVEYPVPRKGETIEAPSGLVTFSAGEHTESLSKCMAAMNKRFERLEASLGSAFAEQIPEASCNGFDLVLRAVLKLDSE